MKASTKALKIYFSFCLLVLILSCFAVTTPYAADIGNCLL